MVERVRNNMQSKYFLILFYFNYLVLVENWKLAFDPTGRNVITCGEMGIVKFFDIETSEKTGLMKSADIFATCLSYVNSQL